MCEYHDNNAICYTCKPDMFHSPTYQKTYRWWTEWETLEDLKGIVFRLNEMYRSDDSRHPWRHLEQIESDRRYGYLVYRIHEMDKDYEELL